MKTIIYDVADPIEDQQLIEEAAEIIRSGGLVAIPTETVYGLGANGLSSDACQKIFDIKERPPDNPLILHVASLKQVESLVREIPPLSMRLMEKLWPGPLTIIFKKSDRIPDIVTAGGDTVAIRMPDNAVTLKLIECAGVPIAAPSANISGRPSPTNAIDVYLDLKDRIEMILDGGGSRIGIESTVIDMESEVPTILRPGFYTKDFLEDIIGEVRLDPHLKIPTETPRSPGLKYKHYAPKADLTAFVGERSRVVKTINEEIEKYQKEGKKVGVLTFTEHMSSYHADAILNLGSYWDTEEIARLLFSKLRDFDRMDVDVILAEGVEEKGLGFAIMNRLRKSAAGRIIEV